MNRRREGGSEGGREEGVDREGGLCDAFAFGLCKGGREGGRKGRASSVWLRRKGREGGREGWMERGKMNF